MSTHINACLEGDRSIALGKAGKRDNKFKEHVIISAVGSLALTIYTGYFWGYSFSFTFFVPSFMLCKGTLVMYSDISKNYLRVKKEQKKFPLAKTQ